MKRCPICTLEKSLADFYKCVGRKDGHQPICKMCSSAKHKAAYARSASYRAGARRRNVERRAMLLEQVRELKTGPCTDCHQIFPPVCMDFDHLSDKSDSISHMVKDGVLWERILEEITKCELVCSNCHRIRTEARRMARS